MRTVRSSRHWGVILTSLDMLGGMILYRQHMDTPGTDRQADRQTDRHDWKRLSSHNFIIG